MVDRVSKVIWFKNGFSGEFWCLMYFLLFIKIYLIKMKILKNVCSLMFFELL